MPGFAANSVLYCSNVDFTGNSLVDGSPQVMQNGQLLIGSAIAPNIRVSTLIAGPGVNILNGPGSITISANDQSIAYTNVDFAHSPYAVTMTDYYISVDSSGGAVTLEFPNTPPARKTWIVKDRTGNASGNNISITTIGGSVAIDGQTTYLIGSNYGAVQLLFNGTSYEVF